MNDSLSQQEHYLLKDYDSASQLTYHIDDLRNKLTCFFLVFNGLAVGGLNLVVKGEAKNLFEPMKLVALLFFIIGVLVC